MRNAQNKAKWLMLEFSERGKNFIGLEWDPKNHLMFEEFDGIHYFDLTMNLEERISTRSFHCKPVKDSDPHECLANYQMERLNCSFPWNRNSHKGLNSCGTKEDATNFKELVNQLRDHTSIERQELSSLDCWVPKCNKTTWKRDAEYSIKSNDTGFVFYIYSSSGVCHTH